MLEVVKTACSLTKPYYAMGRYHTNFGEENWVARWYLWHSFRYRSVRRPDRDIVFDLTLPNRDNGDRKDNKDMSKISKDNA